MKYKIFYSIGDAFKVIDAQDGYELEKKLLWMKNQLGCTPSEINPVFDEDLK